MLEIKNEKYEIILFQVFSRKKNIYYFPGLGVAYLAGYLKNHGYKVGILNSIKKYQACQDFNSEIYKEIKKIILKLLV
ncbi:hypothetical protein JW977_02130 [Candidatus Falkowbacteria bacterium]|nr:hypothetical protein [Candidatus Falkowbacteria bacterium]